MCVKNMCKKFIFILTILISAIFLFNIASVGAKPQGAKSNEIPIAMATDNNYVYPTIVAMTSMLENKKRKHMSRFSYYDFWKGEQRKS